MLFLFAALTGSVGAFAQESVTLHEALRLTLERNPGLQGHRFNLNAAAARREIAAQRPAWEVGVDVENIFGTGRLSAFDDTEVTLRLGTVLELGGKRSGRIALADSERSLTAIGQDAERLDLLADATRQFIAALRAQEERKRAQRAIDLATRTLSLVKARVGAGRAGSLEQHNAELAVVHAVGDAVQSDAEVRAAWAQLSAAWGEAPDASGTVIGDLFALPPTGDYAALAALLESNPDLIRFATQRRVQEAQLRLAVSSESPDITISAGLRRLQNARAQAAVLSASIPLGSAARSYARQDEARNLLSATGYAEAAARNTLRATLFAIHTRLVQKRSHVEMIRDKAFPLADTAVRAAEDGFRAGRFSLLELAAAQKQSLDLQKEAIAAAAEFHLLLLELERLTGTAAPSPEIKP